VIIAPQWQANLPLAGVVIALGLYLLGGRRRSRAAGARGHDAHRWRTVSFLLALAAVVVALQPPLDGLVGVFLWAHMVQHLVLLAVAAPLMVAAAPWLRIWRGLPLSWRRGLARTMVTGRWAAPLRAVGGFLARPGEAWLVFNVNLLAWHLPWMYDLALRNQAVHDVEHLSFLGLAILFWAMVIDTAPFRSQLTQLQRVGFVLAAMVVSWGLAVVLVFATVPIYSYYAALATTPQVVAGTLIYTDPGGLTAVTDQELAGGIMWVPGSIPFSVAIFVFLYRWLDGGQPTARGREGANSGSPGHSSSTLGGV
jgi:cytochrome c oxidase assembly factor CtaG